MFTVSDADGTDQASVFGVHIQIEITAIRENTGRTNNGEIHN